MLLCDAYRHTHGDSKLPPHIAQLAITQVAIPQQPNSCDCGFYMLLLIEGLVRGTAVEHLGNRVDGATIAELRLLIRALFDCASQRGAVCDVADARWATARDSVPQPLSQPVVIPMAEAGEVTPFAVAVVALATPVGQVRSNDNQVTAALEVEPDTKRQKLSPVDSVTRCACCLKARKVGTCSVCARHICNICAISTVSKDPSWKCKRADCKKN